MPHFGKPLAAALGAALLSGTTLVPDAYALAQDYASQPAPIVRPAVVQQLQPVAPPLADEGQSAPGADDDSAPSPPAAADAELTCLAKIVLHEAGNQSRTGQLAVAQVVMNRVHSGRFAGTICGVAMQRGQFFNVHAYNPPHDARWRLALDVARDAREGVSEPVIGDALFFHAAYAGGIGNHHQVGRIGGHIFYR